MVAKMESQVRAWFASKLASALKRRGVQRTPAQKEWLRIELDVSTEQARKYLKGLDIPRAAKLIVLAKKLDTSTEWLTSPESPATHVESARGDDELPFATPRTASRIQELRAKVRNREQLSKTEAAELDALLAKVEALSDAVR